MKYHRLLVSSMGLCVFVGLLVGSGIASAYYFNFENIPTGTPARALTMPGLEFQSDSMTVVDSAGAYDLLSGHVLKCNPPEGGLALRFEELQSNISFLYASDRSRYSDRPDLVLYLFTGGNPTPGIGETVYFSTYHGIVGKNGMAEGGVKVNVDFDYLIMFSPSGCLAIDDLNTSVSGKAKP
jgi:hypothetical protein